MNAHDPLQRLEELLHAVDDVVTDLAGRPSTDADARSNREAVLWIRRTLEDILATCTGMQIGVAQEHSTSHLRVTP